MAENNLIPESNGKSKLVGSFSLPHPWDSGVLAGFSKAAELEQLLIQRNKERALQTNQVSTTKKDFRNYVMVFREPNGSLYGSLVTEWVDENGNTDEENTDAHQRISISQDQYKVLEAWKTSQLTGK